MADRHPALSTWWGAWQWVAGGSPAEAAEPCDALRQVLRVFRYGRGECENRWMVEQFKVVGELINESLQPLTGRNGPMPACQAGCQGYL